MTKPTMWYVHPAKTQIAESDQSLRFPPEDALGLPYPPIKRTAETDQTGRIWTFDGRTY